MQEHPTQRRPRGVRALGWLAIASIVAVAMLGSTSAAVLGVVGTTLHQTPPIASTNVNFQGDDEECAGVGAGQVLWHFVLVQTDAASGTLTVSFTNAGTFNSPSTKKTGKTLHFDVVTGADTLLAASTDAVGKLLNLSHICSGPTTTTITTTTTTITTTTITTTNNTTTTPT
jgi:hypothetical protein